MLGSSITYILEELENFWDVCEKKVLLNSVISFHNKLLEDTKNVLLLANKMKNRKKLCEHRAVRI